jgi:hypothetical protein
MSDHGNGNGTNRQEKCDVEITNNRSIDSAALLAAGKEGELNLEEALRVRWVCEYLVLSNRIYADLGKR